ncbi:hypothetical protein [Rhizobium leguminosarum]|uniref:hypothetical protein n=1 Tax=Rhizobium leguminosarum TaxID=384 RepID=UPI0028F414E9|nr:hypothetical protein [Rhizobium leguminosarum]
MTTTWSSAIRDLPPSRQCRDPKDPNGSPNRSPCLLIGQLAVDHRQVGRGVGTALAKYVFRRCVAGADLVGGRAIVVRAVDEEAERFWQSWGFIPSLDNQSLLLRPMTDIRAWMVSYSTDRASV